MKINTNNLGSITEANQNFFQMAHLIQDSGSSAILTDENVMAIFKRLIERNHQAYEMLAQ